MHLLGLSFVQKKRHIVSLCGRNWVDASVALVQLILLTIRLTAGHEQLMFTYFFLSTIDEQVVV